MVIEFFTNINKMKQTSKALLLALGLGCLNPPALAQLQTDKTELNSSTGHATLSISFSSPLRGDLYVAVLYEGRLIFFDENGGYTNSVVPLKANRNFDSTIDIVRIASNGIPPGVYRLYQVVTLSGLDPLESANWIGGLSQLDLSINLPVPNKSGKALYLNLTCADSVCHGENPKNNLNNIMKGTSLEAIRLSIKKNPITMGRFNSSKDDDLQAIADYLKTL